MLPNSKGIAADGPGSPTLRILFLQALFLATGMISTLGAQWLKYHKAADSRSFLTVFCLYMGMALVGALPNPKPVTTNSVTSSTAAASQSTSILRWLDPSYVAKLIQSHLKSFGPVNHKGVAVVAVVDVVSQLVGVAGLFLVGSGLYMVIYSSLIVFTAIGNRLFLKRWMGWGQWVAVIVISIGLSLTAAGGTHTTDSSSASRVGLGIIVSLFGTWLHALVYTMNDYLLSTPSNSPTTAAASTPTQPPPPPTPRAQCVWVGLYSTAVTTVFMLFVSLPTLSHMAPILIQPQIQFAYLILVLSSLGHNLAYFDLVVSTGAVATGVIQALRAVAVFGISHVWFCERENAQCFTVYKGFATIVVVGGVVGFAAAKGVASAQKYSHGKSYERVKDGEGEDEGDIELADTFSYSERRDAATAKS